MRFQSTWPSKDIFHEYALDYAKKVNDMTGGDLKIDVLPAGAVVPAFGLLDAVSKGTLDGGHGVLVYHYGKQNALALWGSGPGYAMDANMLLAWHKYGGGKELLRKDFTPRSAPTSSRSRTDRCRPSRSAGSRSRSPRSKTSRASSSAPSASRSTCSPAMGAAVNALPGGEIVSAMDRGLLDAAEFNNASSDRLLGFADVSKVCMLQSYHQNAEQMEIIVQQDEVRRAARQDEGASSRTRSRRPAQDMSWKAIDRYSKDYITLQTTDKVKFYKTPDSVLQEAARCLRRSRARRRGEESAVQGNHRVADRVRQAGDAVGAGHGRQPQDGVRSLFRAERARRI